jgi:ribosome-associated toxin RatA of RatAB toxin-antitoxin module
MPLGRLMETIDERLVKAPPIKVFDIVSQVENWPAYLPHYRYVRFRKRLPGGGGIVEMSAYRPFPVAPKDAAHLNWPTWWLSEMTLNPAKPAIRFRHIEGITKGMDVEWTFTPRSGGTLARIVHVWDGPRWPVIGVWAATRLIGPVFIHGIASRTLSGLAEVAEREARAQL